MVWFKQQYLWIIISAAAVCISCQELTSTLRDRSHACRGEEVYFTCIIRGSANSPNLILAWSSTEYIGRGTPLQFTTATVPGENRTSVINRNVTATLISNANISGVPTLVSELRIIADQASTVICTSETITGGETSGVLNVSDVPEAPLNVGATAVILQLSENDCEILVKWDPPTISVDITNYIIYIPVLNMNVTTDSFIKSLLLRDCPESIGVIIAAINRFGCIGSNSSEVHVPVQLIPQSTSDAAPRPESNQLSTPAVAGIIGGAGVLIILIVLVLAMVLYNTRKVKTVKRKLEKEKFRSFLGFLYEALKCNRISSMQEPIHQLLYLMSEKKMPSKYIKEALNTVFETTVTPAGIQDALRQLKEMIQKEMSAMLEGHGRSFSENLVIDTAGEENSEELAKNLKKLKEAVNDASPDEIKDHLQKLFKALQVYLQKEADNLEGKAARRPDPQEAAAATEQDTKF